MDKFVDAQPKGADLSCAHLQGASFTRASFKARISAARNFKGRISIKRSCKARISGRAAQGASLTGVSVWRAQGEPVINLTDFHGCHAGHHAMGTFHVHRAGVIACSRREGERREAEARCQ